MNKDGVRAVESDAWKGWIAQSRAFWMSHWVYGALALIGIMAVNSFSIVGGAYTSAGGGVLLEVLAYLTLFVLMGTIRATDKGYNRWRAGLYGVSFLRQHPPRLVVACITLFIALDVILVDPARLAERLAITGAYDPLTRLALPSVFMTNLWGMSLIFQIACVNQLLPVWLFKAEGHDAREAEVWVYRCEAKNPHLGRGIWVMFPIVMVGISLPLLASAILFLLFWGAVYAAYVDIFEGGSLARNEKMAGEYGASPVGLGG